MRFRKPPKVAGGTARDRRGGLSHNTTSTVRRSSGQVSNDSYNWRATGTAAIQWRGPGAPTTRPLQIARDTLFPLSSEPGLEGALKQALILIFHRDLLNSPLPQKL